MDPPPPLRKYVFSTENKQKLSFSPTSDYVIYEWSPSVRQRHVWVTNVGPLRGVKSQQQRSAVVTSLFFCPRYFYNARILILMPEKLLFQHTIYKRASRVSMPVLLPAKGGLISGVFLVQISKNGCQITPLSIFFLTCYKGSPDSTNFVLTGNHILRNCTKWRLVLSTKNILLKRLFFEKKGQKIILYRGIHTICTILNRTIPRIVLSETVLRGDPLYMAVKQSSRKNIFEIPPCRSHFHFTS